MMPAPTQVQSQFHQRIVLGIVGHMPPVSREYVAPELQMPIFGQRRCDTGSCMLDFIQKHVQFLLLSFSSLIFIVDPIATIPTFLALTSDAELGERRHMAKRAAWTCFAVLAGFAMAGTLIFKMFGITLPAFRIAGGLIMILIGLDMVQARRSQTKETPAETQQAMEKDDVGIIPLGVPMLAGPGPLSTAIALMAQSSNWPQRVSI